MPRLMNLFSVIFGSVSLILVFFDNKTILRFLCRIPGFRKIPTRVQSVVFCIGRALFSLLLASVAVKLGYVFMEDLSRAVAQFYPGGMAGGPGTPTPPGPSENFGLFSYPLEGESSHQGERRGSPSLSAEVPLLSDTQRRIELESELEHLIEHNVYKKTLSDTERENLVTLQLKCDRELEDALRSDGFSDDRILNSRNDWRRIAFTTDSKPQPISFTAIKKQMLKHNNIKNTIYYKRIKNALKNYTLRI